MTVQNTESRLPDGLEAKDLGQAVENGDFKLISYLTQPLRYEEGKKALTNTYVVFDTGGTSNPSDYRWKFEFEIEGQDDAIELSDLEGVEGGAVFNLNSEEGDFEDALEGKIVTKITTTVALDVNATNVLIMEQTVDGLDEDIEALIANFDNEKGANAGEPKTTRRIANEYKNYLIALGKDKGEAELAKVSLNLLATLLYQAIESDAGFFSRASDYLFNPDEEDWMNYANGEGGVEFNDLVGTKISILDVKPHVFYFLHQPPGAGTPYQDYVYDEDQESLDSFEEEILSNLNSLSATEEIDLVNRLRFPKSCLYSVWTYLKHLKERHNDYLSKVLDKDNHSTNRECISTVVTEFETAPQNNLDGPSSTAVQAYDVMYSKWMQAILKTSKIQMEIVKIKVLDIRSGKPIKNSRVRKLIVYGTQSAVIKKFGTNGEVDLLYERDRIVENDPLRAAQIALLRLGYAPAPIDREDANEETLGGWCDGAWDGQTSQAYNQYLQDRILSTDMNAGAAAADQPSDRDLKAIKNDYNGHAYTDDSGVIEVRIPKVFMDGRSINIDIQFWEIPIVREEIEDDSGDPITRPSTDEAATDFVVSWVGGTGANQKVNWTDYVVNNQIVEASDFGWEVTKDDRSSKLKAVQRLIVKDDEDDFDGYDTSLLSKFYDSDSYPIHFVLFGMVWCQPLVDGLDDVFVGEHRSNRRVFRNRYNPSGDWIENLNMHLVTKHVGNSNYRYGFFDRSNPESTASGQQGQHNYRGRAHDSADIYSGSVGIGVTNCFASHGGKFINGPNSGSYGNNNVFIEFANPYSFNINNREKRFRYMHLSRREPLNNQIVQAGTIIGQTGREGNFAVSSPSHLHLELINKGQNASVSSMEPSQYLAVNDPANASCLPGNDLPLLLPCAAIYNYAVGSNDDPGGCDFSNDNVVSTCWAVQKFPEYDYHVNRIFPNEEFPEQVVVDNFHMFACPFVHFEQPVSLDVFWIQAHLKFVFVNRGRGDIPNVDYHNPGGIDNSLGAAVNNVEINLQTGDVVNILDTDNNRKQIRVQKGGVSGWMLNLDVFIVGTTMQVDMKYVATNKITANTNIAIGVYRALTPDIDFNLNDYASNFSIDNDLADNLREKMVVYEDI
jgi:hypothetical protein